MNTAEVALAVAGANMLAAQIGFFVMVYTGRWKLTLSTPGKPRVQPDKAVSVADIGPVVAEAATLTDPAAQLRNVGAA